MKYRSLLLCGSPGSGKSTQGRLLGAKPGFFHFASGDAFRSLKPDDPLGRLFRDYAGRGQLVPDAQVLELWRRQMAALVDEGRFDPQRHTLVLDGIPRTLSQARLLQEDLDVRGVLHLTCPDQDRIVERLRGRALAEHRLDDADVAVIRRRLDTYDRQTRPLLDFYGPGLVHPIDCSQSPARVQEEIERVLVSLLS